MHGLSATLMLLATWTVPTPAASQFSSPCEVACALTLGGTAAAAATGMSVAWAQVSGGISSRREALAVWGTSFALTAGSGIALAGDGGRQRGTVYGSAAGTVAGSALGMALGTWLGDEATPPGVQRVAGALVGAAVGAWIGGVYGALSHGAAEPPGDVPLFLVTLRF
jgi:hypothetical protein